MIYIVSSVAGGGKTTLINQLIKENPDLLYSVSYTTRKPREGEINGIHYTFVTIEEFKKLNSENFFIESAEVHENFYGTPRHPIEDAIEKNLNMILDIDVQGANIIRKKLKKCTSIFIVPPSREIWIERLKSRGTEKKEEVERRIQNGEKELKFKDEFDYQIINNKFSDALNELKKIIYK